MFNFTIKPHSRTGIVACWKLGAPGSIPVGASNFYTISPVIWITTRIADNISWMWSKVDNFSWYFSTNSRENFPTNHLLFQTREISKGVPLIPIVMIQVRIKLSVPVITTLTQKFLFHLKVSVLSTPTAVYSNPSVTTKCLMTCSSTGYVKLKKWADLKPF